MTEKRLWISDLARKTGVAASTIRYYEEIELLPPAERTENEYRIYGPQDVERLRFIQRAKHLNFTLNEISEILELREHGAAPCAFVISQISNKLSEVERKIVEMEHLKAELQLLQNEVAQLPQKEVAAKECVCHFIENESLPHLSELTAQAFSGA